MNSEQFNFELEDMRHDVNIMAELIEHSNFNGGTVLDIGACVGIFTERILDDYPTSRVYSFEPNDTNFTYLVDRVTGKNVIPMNMAVTNNEEEITFYVCEGIQQGVVFNSMYRQQHRDIFIDEYVVQGIPLRRAINLIRPSLVKIDVEGYEYFYDYSNLSDSVNTIVMEVHMSDINIEGKIIRGAINNDVEKYSNIINQLKLQGFDYVINPDYNFPWNGSWDGSSNTHLLCMTR